MIEKNLKTVIFMYFYAFSQYVCGRKIKSNWYFTWGKLEKKYVEKHFNNEKSGNFQKVLFESKSRFE